jgi:transglutaminase-like putative cysteine protease
MNRIRTRLTALLLAAAMILASAPANAHAEVVHRIKNLIRPSATAGQWINPQYETLVTVPAQKVQLRTEAPVVTIDDVRHTLTDAADELRQGMVDRMAQIAVTFSVDAEFDATDIWNEALKHTGQPREGDYLLGQLSSYGFSAYYNELGDEAYFTYVFKPGYFTTAQQEQQMDDAVDALLLELNLDDATEYEKIKGVYDWICANVTYDYENLDNKNYYLKHSAYAALINRTAVCQGFAVLFYRLALELGVDCRYITGTGNGGSHAWNIVKLGSLYYNVDATWDQPIYEYGMPYEFFLRCGANFLDHSRDDEYASAEFYQQYPMSPEDYGTDVSWPVSGTCGEGLNWLLDEQGTLTISGNGKMADFYAEDPQWQQYAYHIRKVVIGPDVQSVGAFSFYYCSNLTHVDIQGSAVICESAFSYCFSLQNISIPYVLAIGDGAFYGCSSLVAVHLPASMQNLGNEVFYDCVLLQNITVDAANPYYTAKDNVLFNKDMTHLYMAASMMGQIYSVPEGVTEISPYAFRGNRQLQLVVIPKSVTEISEGVFYGCTALRSVTFMGSVNLIGPFAFYGSAALAQVVLPNGLQQIGDYAFGYTDLDSITVPASVTVIGNGAFDHSTLTTITFTGPAPQIGENAFGNVFADVYYPSPSCDESWIDAIWDYGGFLQWYPTDQHSYHASVTAPGCETPGFTTYTCSCGHSYVGDHTDATGHKWDAGKITQEPTYTDPGKCTYMCSTCGAIRVEDIPPITHEHQYSASVTAPSCTADGFTTFTCTQCNHSYVDDVVPALGHSFTNYTGNGDSACGVDGTKTAVCDHGCGEKDTVIDIGSAKSHDYSTVVTAPTCTENGFTTHTCSLCRDTYTDSVVPAMGHSFTNYISDHNASCTADGTKTAVCDHGCGITDCVADAGSRKPHDMEDWQTVAEATEEAEGLKRRNCKNCDYQEEQSIPKINPIQDITSDVYAVSGEMIGNIPAGTTIAQFLSAIHEAQYVAVIKDGQTVSAEAFISTGMEVHLTVNGQLIKTLTAVVTGDVNGDGEITLSDMLMVKSHLLNKSVLTGAAALAADTNDDKGISITDFLQVKAHILGKNQIKPHG